MRRPLTCSTDLIRRLRQFCYYSHGSTAISEKLIRFRIGICKKRTLSEELRGCFQI
ncbi:hypothetical protein Gogos_012908 [Gossypium gossypioides]|uniref:Uncharacterized protein n=1 Tax=Gossypium gossypioides TaxID=34282 RepID=A0A7J9BTY7_GOSGO|nr:hypothetical protein [Gossypium gossypioides]